MDELVLEIEGVCERWLRPHICRLASSPRRLGSCEIRDVLWGAVRLHPWEVALFDTPLIQRLRYVRQLGVVHWAYPSATHSRLEHSLGALHQMSELLAALDRNSTTREAPISAGDAKLLRIAALVHDAGHSAMSHASEAFVADLPGVLALRARLRDEHRTRALPSPSEAIAAVLVCAPAFRDLLALPELGIDFVSDFAEATRKIAAFILGGTRNESDAFLSLLLSGPFDADKLDYMPRDCLMSGVPCALDARGVIAAIRCAYVHEAELAQNAPCFRIRAIPRDSQGRIAVVSLGEDGKRALEAIAETRSSLYGDVYYHHKVRAAETMARRALLRMGPLGIADWLELVDDDLLLERQPGHFSALRERRLLKRVLVIPKPEPGTAEHSAWVALCRKLPEFQRSVHDVALEIARRLGTGTSALEDEPVALDLPPITKIRLDTTALETASGVSALGSRVAQAERQPVHVFAPEAAAAPVFVAAKRLLAERFGIHVPDGEATARLDPDAIRSAEALLAPPESRVTAAGHATGHRAVPAFAYARSVDPDSVP